MISKRYIQQWEQHTPWKNQDMVEQDLIIHRCLLEIFQDPYLQKRLVFRGGTALYKLFIHPPLRYSEDIDLVCIEPGPMGEVIDRIRDRLEPIFQSPPRRELKKHSVQLRFSFVSETGKNLKLKIEINTIENFSVFPTIFKDFELNHSWSSGQCKIQTYELEELLGTKLRALYQRKKGRDLFDLWAFLTLKQPDQNKIVQCFQRYVKEQGLHITQAEFMSNLEEKFLSKAFLQDISPILASNFSYDIEKARALVQDELIALVS